MIQHLVAAGVAAGITAFMTPVVRRASRRLGAVDVPEDRKVHKLPTPTSGGVAIYLGVLAGVVAARVLPAFREL